MTILNVMVDSDRVLISSDSAVAAPPVGEPMEGAASADLGELARAFADPDSPCYPLEATSYRHKIATLPEWRRIVTGAGMVLPTVAAVGVLAFWGGEALEADVGLVAAELSSLTATAPAGASSGMVVVAGWEEGVGAAAYALMSGSGWLPQKLDLGLACCPIPHPKVMDFAALMRRVMDRPEDVEAVHLELARAQAETARRGLYKAAPTIAGDVWLATVDRDGARQRVIGHV